MQNYRSISEDVLSVIKQKYPKMSKSHKAIAAFITDYYDQAVFMTAAQLGEQVEVSESTVVRFASALGYKGYPEFQKALEAWVKNKFNTVSKVGARYGASSQSEIIRSVLTSDIEKIQSTIDEVDPAAFESAIDAIMDAENVYICGIRSCEPLAEFFAFYLQMIRGNVITVKSTSATEIFEQMIRIGSKDVMIGISFPRYSMRTLKAMEFANDRNARVIAITDSVHSPMNLYSSINLFAKSEAVSIVDSLVAPLSLINAMVIDLCLRNPDQVKNNLETLENAWGNYQVYLNDEINFIDEDNMFHPSLWNENE